MKAFCSLIIAGLLFSQTLFASCDRPVTYLAEGKPATCNGYLFSPEMELSVRTKILNYDNMDLLVKKQDELITILNSRISVNEEMNNNLRKSLSNQETKSQMEKWLYFGAGVLITGLILKK